MEPIASFSGLASGVQWRDMIDQIMVLERAPIRRIQSRIATVETRSSAWATFRTRVEALEDALADLADGSAFGRRTVALSGVPSGTTSPLRASAGEGADPGSYRVRVLQTAAREKLGGASFSSRTDALGITGEILVNGRRVTVTATDSLERIASTLNGANAGSDGTGVAASVLTTSEGGYRLVLTSDDAGARGIDLLDAGGGVLGSLGLVDGSTSIKSATSDGYRSDGFADATTAVGSLRGLTSAPAGTVMIGGLDVAVDLTTDSLDDIAAAVNARATALGSGITAAVVSETVDGETVHRLDVSGTTAYTDAGGVLEVLGVVEGDRAGVTRQIGGAALTEAGAPATGATRLSDLDAGATGVQSNDTFTVNGTRGDGTTFTFTYTVGNPNNETLADVASAIEAQFDAGSSGASVTIAADGSLQVTDDAAGDSRLALSVVAHNEGGGTLDFGSFSTLEAGYARELTAGRDAEVEVDGALYTRSSNSVSDIVGGLTLNLDVADADTAVDITVERDEAAVEKAVEALVEAYNAVDEFVGKQFSGGEGAAKPLSGDSTLRTMRDRLRTAMKTRLATGVAGDLERLADVGIEVDRYGQYQLDSSALGDALSTDFEAVRRLFGLHGSTTSGLLTYLGGSDDTEPGSYAVDITTAAAQATVLGSGFDGVLDAADTLTLTDADTGQTYEVALGAGASTDEIVAAVSAELATATSHTLESTGGLYADPGATTGVDASTTWDSVYRPDGTSAGFVDGSVLTFSGTLPDGGSFSGSYTVVDAATDTVAGFLSAVEAELGGEATVSLVDGKLRVADAGTGSSVLALEVQSDVTGTTSPFGTVDSVIREGRSAAAITVENDGGQVRITHDDYGSEKGFSLDFGAAATAAELGLAEQAYAGTDVAGTIGGYAATGRGRTLTGAGATPVSGLDVEWTGGAGSAGEVTFSRGVAAVIGQVTDALLGSETGSIQSTIETLGNTIGSHEDRIVDLEDRLERRRADLVRRFTAMEQAMATAQNQMQWLASQIGTLPSWSSPE